MKTLNKGIIFLVAFFIIVLSVLVLGTLHWYSNHQSTDIKEEIGSNNTTNLYLKSFCICRVDLSQECMKMVHIINPAIQPFTS